MTPVPMWLLMKGSLSIGSIICVGLPRHDGRVLVLPCTPSHHLHLRWWFNLPFELWMSDVGLQVAGMECGTNLPPYRQLELLGNLSYHLGDAEMFPSSVASTSLADV